MSRESLLKILNSAPAELRTAAESCFGTAQPIESPQHRWKRRVLVDRVGEKLLYPPGHPEITPRRIQSPGEHRNRIKEGIKLTHQEMTDEGLIYMARIIKYCETQFQDPRWRTAVRQAMLTRLESIFNISTSPTATALDRLFPVVSIPIQDQELTYDFFRRKASLGENEAQFSEAENLMLYFLMRAKYLGEELDNQDLTQLSGSKAKSKNTVETFLTRIRKKLPGVPISYKQIPYTFTSDLDDSAMIDIERLINSEVAFTYGLNYTLFIDVVTSQIILNGQQFKVSNFAARTAYLLAVRKNHLIDNDQIATIVELNNVLPESQKAEPSRTEEQAIASTQTNFTRLLYTIPSLPMITYPGRGVKLGDQLTTTPIPVRPSLNNH